jgi:hypothetical protein
MMGSGESWRVLVCPIGLCAFWWLLVGSGASCQVPVRFAGFWCILVVVFWWFVVRSGGFC